MDTSLYLSAFEKAAGGLDASLLAQKGWQVEVGIWLESVVLRMHKRSWANKPLTRPQADTAIFFSIWVNVNDRGVKTDRLFYNIHALKLRQLQGYTITSRDFAADFRARFQPFARHWPNVSVDFGPLTLMEGWAALNISPLTAATANPATLATADTATLATADPATLATADTATLSTVDQSSEATADQTSEATADQTSEATADQASEATADPATKATADHPAAAIAAQVSALASGFLALAPLIDTLLEQRLKKAPAQTRRGR